MADDQPFRNMRLPGIAVVQILSDEQDERTPGRTIPLVSMFTERKRIQAFAGSSPQFGIICSNGGGRLSSYVEWLIAIITE